MSPNIKVVVHQDFGINHANPYKDEAHQGNGHLGPNAMPEAVPRARDPANPQGEPGNDADGRNAPRPIRSVARHTYELDRFRKNAMLIFYNINDPINVSTAKQVKRTFEGFRFDVQMHSSGNQARDKAVLKEFFEQDFADCGCVAVVVVTQTPTDEDVLYYFDRGYKQTLNGKPKIFISEQKEINSAKKVRLLDALMLFQNRFQQSDVFHLQLQNSSHTVRNLNEDTTQNPLSLLCEKIDNLAEEKHLEEIVQFAGRSIHQAVLDRDVRNARETYTIASSLSKELWLWRMV